MARSSLDRTISKRDKVNAVSKASLAMLNPAYAMGIESGLTWLEARESITDLAGLSEFHDATPELEAFADADNDHTEPLFTESPAQLRMIGHSHTKSVFDDEDLPVPSPTSSTFSQSSASSSAASSAAGMGGRNSTVKLRKLPGRSGANATSNSLSRFFSWKQRSQGSSTNLNNIKITRHGDAVLASTMFGDLDEQPRSAPSHIQTFDAAHGYSDEPSGASSLPTTPYYATQELPPLSTGSSSSISSNNSSSPPSSISEMDSQSSDRNLGRKHSMPSLREVRSKNACHTGDSSLSNGFDDPFYWRQEQSHPSRAQLFMSAPVPDERKTSGSEQQHMHQHIASYSNNSFGTKSPSMKSTTSSRISSVGRGAIRKSIAPLQLFDSPLCQSPTMNNFGNHQMEELTSYKSPKSPKSPRSSGSKSRRRFDPVNSPDMPSLPLGAATLAEAVKQGLFGTKGATSLPHVSEKKMAEAAITTDNDEQSSRRRKEIYQSRRRSRSVGALDGPTDLQSTLFSTMVGLPEAASELDLEAILAPSATLSSSSTRRDPCDTRHGPQDHEADIYGGLANEYCAVSQIKRHREPSNGGGDTPKLGEGNEEGSRDNHWGSPSALVARRVQLNHGNNIVGVSSPKLVSLSPRLAGSARLSPRTASPSKLAPVSSPLVDREKATHEEARRENLRLQALLVNVMPPTPDLGAGEEDTFEGETPSPSVLRTARQEHRTEHDNDSDSDEDETFSGEEAYPAMLGENANSYNESEAQGGRHVSGISVKTTSETTSISSLGLSCDAAMSQDEDEYEPFGFARSLSSSSLASSADSLEDNENAQIVVASSTSATFEKATLLGGASPASSSASLSSMSPLSSVPSPWGSVTSSSADSLSSGASSVSSNDSSTKRRVSRVGLSTLSSGQSLASVITTSTSILDFGTDGLGLGSLGEDDVLKISKDKTAKRRSGDLFSPVEIRGLASQADDEDDCDTPRLSSGNGFECFPTTTQMKLAGIQPTRPLQLRKNQTKAANATSSPVPQTSVFSTPSSYRIPRGQSASSPHLELDLSLPLDLDDIGLGLDLSSVRASGLRKMRQQSLTSPTKPPKSAGRRRPQQAPSMKRTSSAPEPNVPSCSTLEPKTPPRPHATKPQEPPSGSFEAAFGLGLGLALDIDEGAQPSSKTSRPPSAIGFAL